MSQETWKIVNGPSKYDLVLAFSERFFDPVRPRTVEFVVEHGPLVHRHTMVIESMRHEDGSGMSFLVSASVLATDGKAVARARRTDFWYRADRRVGTITKIDRASEALA